MLWEGIFVSVIRKILHFLSNKFQPSDDGSPEPTSDVSDPQVSSTTPSPLPDVLPSPNSNTESKEPERGADEKPAESEEGNDKDKAPDA